MLHLPFCMTKCALYYRIRQTDLPVVTIFGVDYNVSASSLGGIKVQRFILLKYRV